jgi:hypothetical protein
MRSRLLTRLVHSLVAVLLFAGALIPFAPTGRAASDEEEQAVAGRLGGPLSTFIARFGEPVGYIDARGPVYAIDGYGFFTVHVEGEGGFLGRDENGASIYQGQDPDARLDRVNFSSPRKPERPAGEPDPADWTIDEATERVLEILPTDAELSEWGETADGQRSATCQSDALAEIYAESETLRCYVVLVMSGRDTVSYVTLTLSSFAETGDEKAPAAVNPCEGAVGWIKAAGDRLVEIQELIAQVAEIDESDPAAVETLRGLAATFRDLAAEQRNATVPAVAAQGNYYLIQALTTYANAIETAADGVEQQDQALVDDAVKTFEQAGAHIANVTAEIEAAGEDCALQLGAPSPAASPEP